MKIKKTLIIAPHPDDEINLAGQALIELNKNKIETYIVFTTNGNAEKKLGNKRLKEAINSLNVVEIDENHIIFLGYANEWKHRKHVYNAQKKEVCISLVDTNKTDSIKTHPEYFCKKEKLHHLFTRGNFKADMKGVVLDIAPELIICVDFDRHVDHRAASLMFDEVMGEILKENKLYRPVILKKFAYNGVWLGERDYYCHPFCRTKNIGDFFYSGQTHELESPNLLWNERKSYAVDERTKTTMLRKNILYKMAKKHTSTTAWWQMQRVINADMVYWERKTENLLFDADISVSSGDSSYLNDFKYYDTRDVYDTKDPFWDSSIFCWQPDENDNNPVIEIRFCQLVEIKTICIWEDCNIGNHIVSLDVVCNSEMAINQELAGDGSCTKIEFSSVVKSDKVEIYLKRWTGRPGIAEIEIYGKEEPIENFPFHEYSEDISDNHKICHNYQMNIFFEKIFLSIIYLFKFKIRYEVKRRIFHRKV